MDKWDPILRELADDPSEYERQAGLVLMVRQGREYQIRLKEIPSCGLSVELPAGDGRGTAQFVPISAYVQRELLELPRLAQQIQKALQRSPTKRVGRFIQGPAQCDRGADKQVLAEAGKEFQSLVCEGDPGTTCIVQLMAAAGKGKTVLLENTAIELARRYQPVEYPTPLLLPVDLLGRYVGTVDDAIAGSLNNTYMFPRLTQRDVTVCIRNRWVILALDGFDELVARVGARDAFLRITELLDQLHGSGTIVVSARESFFELYRVSAAIRTYLQPRRGGSYSTTIVNLLPWGERQGIDVFEGLGSASPKDDVGALLRAFDGDEEIVYHPFFLVRLADLWIRGERFGTVGPGGDLLARTQYLIDTFIDRESKEKWVDRDGNALLDTDGHAAMLGGIAEEMWRSGAFRLDAEEIRVAAELGLAELPLAPSQRDAAIERAPTHAAISGRGAWFSFIHDKFLHYFLGYRLSALLMKAASREVAELLRPRDLDPSVVDWIVWRCRGLGAQPAALVEFLNTLRAQNDDSAIAPNAAQICAKLLRDAEGVTGVAVHRQTFVGDVLRGGRFTEVRFDECRFWSVDLSGSRMSKCDFTDCEFGDVYANHETRLDGSKLTRARVASLEFDDGSMFFAPEDIAARFRELGAIMVAGAAGATPPPPRSEVSEEVAACLTRLVNESQRTCDVVVEEFRHRRGPIADDVLQVALGAGVLREINRPASGPKKRFVRFAVDRGLLLRGRSGASGDKRIDAFWRELQRKHPRTP
jgi:hypothetical protein